MDYVIDIKRDEKAGVWIAHNSRIPIILEDEKLETLMARVEVAAQELTELNGIPSPTSLSFSIQIIMKEESLVNG